MYLTCSKRYETTLSWFVVYKQLSGFLWPHLQIEKTNLERSSNLPKSDNWWSAESKLTSTSRGLKSSAMFYLHDATSWLLVWSQCQTLFGAECKLTDNSISAVSIFLCSKLQRICINVCLISLLRVFEDSCRSFYITRILSVSWEAGISLSIFLSHAYGYHYQWLCSYSQLLSFPNTYQLLLLKTLSAQLMILYEQIRVVWKVKPSEFQL